MCSFAGCKSEPDFAFSIVFCFGFLTPGDRSPTLWIKSLGFPPTSPSCNWLAACCLDQPRTSSSKPCPPSRTIEPPPEPRVPSTDQLQSHLYAAPLSFSPPCGLSLIPICFPVPAPSVPSRSL
ncbi:hypothetical protein CHARACLAT_006075 [Characodon lateralis]|uniref:Uncharacterized protein n=1 Tax=Characodon lateralis TaxID=208331 RepID=A0ABU7F169_9TELE|nr:hypothetical protein [Characodon lateralis]